MIAITLSMCVFLSFLSVSLSCPKCPALKYCSSSERLRALTVEIYDKDEDGEKIYSGCNIPDPQLKPEECGLEEAGWVCDPNGVLPKQHCELAVLFFYSVFLRYHYFLLIIAMDIQNSARL